MSTNSTISVFTEEGVKSIYCHWDGSPEHHMPILKKYYSTQEKAEALMALVNLSELSISTECPEGHSFRTPIRGYCIAYGRDMGVDHQEYQIIAANDETVAREKLVKILDLQSYNYVFNEGRWQMLEEEYE